MHRSAQWEPCLPVDLPPFLADLLSTQAAGPPPRPCGCVRQHGGSGRYVFTAPEGGHHRRSNYARRVFRPACDGRYEPVKGRPGKLVIADASAWPGVPVAAWPPPRPDGSFAPPSGRGNQRIPTDTPLACWLPVRKGLTPHGLRHSLKTWMTEDGIPEILAERRLGHDVPGMGGLYAHVSQRMRDELTAALQARSEDSLRQRAMIDPHSPVPVLDGLLAPLCGRPDHPIWETHPKMVSQIPPNKEEDSIRQVG